MELPQIGKQCAEPNCQQLDFLPLQCKCGKIFCSDHYNSHSQTCSVAPDNRPVNLQTIKDLFVCSFENCEETSLVPIICDRCQKHFCVKHRHVIGSGCMEKKPEELAAEREKYNIPVRLFNEAKLAVDKQLENSLQQAKKKEKSPNMARKVELMRIKNKATGLKTIPTTDRVYFNVTQPKSISGKTIALYVSKSWSLGRVIDAVAQECNVPNNNNKSNQKKLRLFKMDDNRVISSELSEPLEGLLRNERILDGESLFMEYVDEFCEVYQ